MWTLRFGLNFRQRAVEPSFANCESKGPWSPGGKALFVRGQMLVYDIGWLGAVQGGARVNDGKVKTALLHSRNKKVELFLDGKLIGSRKNFGNPIQAVMCSRLTKERMISQCPLTRERFLI